MRLLQLEGRESPVNQPGVVIFAVPSEDLFFGMPPEEWVATASQGMGSFITPIPVIEAYRPLYDEAIRQALAQLPGDPVVVDQAQAAVEQTIDQENGKPVRVVRYLRLAMQLVPGTGVTKPEGFPSPSQVREDFVALIASADIGEAERKRLRTNARDPGTTLMSLMSLYYTAVAKAEYLRQADRYAADCAQIAYAAWRECFQVGPAKSEKPLWHECVPPRREAWIARTYETLTGAPPVDDSDFGLFAREVARAAFRMMVESEQKDRPQGGSDVVS